MMGRSAALAGDDGEDKKSKKNFSGFSRESHENLAGAWPRCTGMDTAVAGEVLRTVGVLEEQRGERETFTKKWWRLLKFKQEG